MNYKRMFGKKLSGINGKPLLSIVISAGLIVFSFLVVVDTLESIADAHEKAKIVEQQQGKVAGLRTENLQKKQELSEVLSDEYVEEQARDSFGYVKNGEVVFILPKSGLESDNTKNNSRRADFVSKPLDQWIEVIFAK